jgi:hypothetical protein
MKYSKLNLAKEAINHKGFVKKIPDIFRMIKMWRKGEYPMRSLDIRDLTDRSSAGSCRPCNWRSG